MWAEEKELVKGYNAELMLIRMMGDPLHHINLQEKKIKVPVDDAGVKEAVTIHFIKDTAIISGNNVSREKAITKASKIFRWERDLQEIHNHFRQTDLKPLFNRFKGAPLVTEFDPYGCLLKTIIHQQLNMAFAYTLSTRFVHTFGIERDGVWFYPSPQDVAELKTDDLKRLQFSGRKAEYVIDTSRQIAENNLDLENLSEKNDEEIIKRLTAIRGIGPWTAECFLVFGLGRENLMPAADIGIQNGLKNLLNLDKKPTKEDIYGMADQWAPYNSYAALYIWLSTELPEWREEDNETAT